MATINLYKANKAKRRHSMEPKRCFGVLICGYGSSFFFTIIGILLISLWSVIYEAIIRNNLILTPGSNTYEIWEKTPIPVSLKLFLFNWTNPHEIRDNTTKPRFQQIGPYTYRESKEKAHVIWNANNTITYKNVKRWWFDPARSNGSLNDAFVSLNPVGLSAAYAARDWHYLVKKGLSLSFSSMMHSVYIVQPVGNVLFDGYPDPLLSMAAKIPLMAKNKIPLMDKFGWFYGRNGSTEFDGVFNIETGVNGRIGMLNSWKYENRTPYFPDHCGGFEDASAGDFFPRKLTKTSIVKMFSSDLCRYIELEFEEEVVINGLLGYKYSAQDRFLDNDNSELVSLIITEIPMVELEIRAPGTKIPENKCFCDGDCMPSGALNVSNCRHGSPSFVTLPHFYKADPYYLQQIEGIVPSHKTDNFYMVFEPNTGVPLEVAARLQLNLRLQSIESVTIYENLPTVFFPILYFEQFVTVPDSMTFALKLLVNFEVICTAIGISLIGIGIVILILTCYKMCTTNLLGKNAKTHQMIREELPLKQ